METIKVNVQLDDGAYMPIKAHEEDAGFDLRSPITVVCEAHGSTWVDTGVHMQIPNGYVGMLKSKSGLNMNNGINIEGVVDAGYTGSIRCKIYNHGDYGYTFCKGDKLVQIVIMPIPYVILNKVESIDGGERGANGFGSTGK